MPNLKRILSRDNNRCGIHTEGCQKKITNNDATVDHIFPKAFMKTRPNIYEFQREWNYQPMCEKCNHKRSGCMVNDIKFNCDCHGIHIDDDGNRWAMYKKMNGKKVVWKRIKYLNGSAKFNEYKNPSLLAGKNCNMTATMGKAGSIMGISAFQNKKLGLAKVGHMFEPIQFYDRIITNSIEFERTKQWKNLAFEIEIFSKHWFSDEGKSLKKESSKDYIDTIAKFLYWTEFLKDKHNIVFKEANILTTRMENESVKGDNECQKILKLVKRQIDGTYMLTRKAKTSPAIAFFGFKETNNKKEEISKMEYAKKLLKSGKDAESIKILTKFISNYPNSHKAAALLWNIKMQCEDYLGAKADLDKDLKKSNVLLSPLYLLRARTNRLLENLIEAQEDAEKSMKHLRDLEDDFKILEVSMDKADVIPMDKSSFKKLISQELSLIERIKLHKSALQYVSQGKFNDAISLCNHFFSKKNSAWADMEITDQETAIFFKIRLYARIFSTRGIFGIVQLANDIENLEKEIEQEILDYPSNPKKIESLVKIEFFNWKIPISFKDGTSKMVPLKNIKINKKLTR